MSAEKPAGMGAGKIVLIVVAVLFGLGLICCAGCWFMGGKYVWHVGKPTAEMIQTLQKSLGEGASAVAVPDQTQPGSPFILVVQLPGQLTPELVAKAQDEGWKAYAKAFAGGGVGVTRVVVGNQAAASADNTISAEDVAKRTGVPAPPDAPWLEEMREHAKAEGVKVEVKSSGGAEDDSDEKPPEDAPK